MEWMTVPLWLLATYYAYVVSKSRGHNPIGYTILVFIAPVFLPLVLLLQKTDQQKLLEANRSHLPNSPLQEVGVNKEKVFRVLERAKVKSRQFWGLLCGAKMETSIMQFLIKTVVIAATAALVYYALSPYERCVRQHGEDMAGWCGQFTNW